MNTALPKIALVAAVARNRVIGVAGDLPWRLPEDLAFFKSITLGKPMLMGRRTWESLPGPLPGRFHIIVSATLASCAVPDKVGCVARTLQQAQEALTTKALELKSEEATIIGGGVVYREWIGLADRLYLTHVDAAPKGDTWFPEFDPTDWHTHTLTTHSAQNGQPSFIIKRYDRIDG